MVILHLPHNQSWPRLVILPSRHTLSWPKLVILRFEETESWILLYVLRSYTISAIIHNLFGPEGTEVRPTIEAAIGGSDVSIEQGLVFVQEDSDEDGIGRRG